MIKECPLIYIDKEQTYPFELCKLIKAKAYILEPYFNLINSDNNDMDIYIRNLLESREQSTNIYIEQLFNSALRILAKYRLIGFHNTRVLDIATLRSSGIHLLNAMEYIQRMRIIFNKLEIPHDSAELAIQSIVKFLNSPDRTPRLNKVSFYTPFSLCKDYGKFLLNIGGEVCKFSFKNEVPTVYDALTSNGIPVAIRFHFRFSDIVSHQQEFLVSEFIRFFAAKYILKYKYSFVFNGEIIKEISPANILEIIENPPKRTPL
jgi:hypothetical protein